MSTGSPTPGAALRAPRWIVNLGILLLCLIWGGTWLVIREGLRDLPVAGSAALRFTLAAIVFCGVARPLARAEGGERPTLFLTVAHGLFTIAVPYGLIYWAETTLPSALVSVLFSVYPLFLGVTTHLLLPDERLRGRQWLGLLGGFLGVSLLFATDVSAVGPGAFLVAAVTLLSPASSAIGTTLVKRNGARTSSALLNRNGLLMGAALLAGWAILRERGAEWDLTGAAIGGVLYLSLVGTSLAFGVYFWLLRHAPATRLSLIAYGAPVVAVTLGGTVGGEPVGAHTWLGLGLIFSGVALFAAGATGRRS